MEETQSTFYIYYTYIFYSFNRLRKAFLRINTRRVIALFQVVYRNEYIFDFIGNTRIKGKPASSGI